MKKIKILYANSLLLTLILISVVLIPANFANAAISYQRQPAGALIPSGTSVTVAVTGVNFSSVCGDVAGNSWGLYILRSDSINPKTVDISTSSRFVSVNATARDDGSGVLIRF